MARIPEGSGRRIAGWSPARVAAAAAPKGLAGPAVFLAVTVAALYFARDIFIPIVIAVLLSFVLGALVNLLRRLGLPRIVAILLSVLTAVGIVGMLSAVIGMQLADLAGQAPRYSSVVERKIEDLKEGTVGRAGDYLRVIGREIHRAGTAEPEPAAPQSGVGSKPAAGEERKPVLVEVREPEQSPLQLARTILAPTLAPLTTAGIVFVVLMFILIQREDLRDRLIRLVGSNDLHRTTGAMDDAAKRLSRYFVVQVLLNGAFGIIVGVGLWAIGVPNPVLWGIFSALMRFVPYIGAFISAILPLALATAVDPGWSMVLLTLGLFLVIETLTGQVIEPLVYGHSTGLSPFAVLVSALFWTWLWGPVGLLLSTPLTVCLVVLGRHVEQLEFLDVLFGDQPALTPVENFYQRILADDPDEAQEQAETMLKETSLIAYYDAVVVKALRLASIDAQRGVLTDEQLERVKTSIHDLVAELADHDDDAAPGAGQAFASRLFAKRPGAAAEAEALAAAPAKARGDLPAQWREEGAVLCVAGRGPLDEAAAALLAQLLGRHGFGVRVLSRPETSRARLEELDPHRTRMACVVHLDMLGSSSHLRFLVQRLRRRLPETAVLVGLWPETAEAGPRRDTGADVDVVSLQEAVEACAARALQHDALARLSATAPTPQREAAAAEPAPV